MMKIDFDKALKFEIDGLPKPNMYFLLYLKFTNGGIVVPAISNDFSTIANFSKTLSIFDESGNAKSYNPESGYTIKGWFPLFENDAYKMEIEMIKPKHD